MYKNDRQEEEKIRVIARVLQTFVLATAILILITTLTLISWRFARHNG